MRKISLKTILLVMMLGVTMVAMLLFNAVYGNLADETFSQMDLKLITQNMEQARDKLDLLFSDAEAMFSYISGNVLMNENFSSERFKLIVNPMIQLESGLHSVMLYARSGTLVAATGTSSSGEQGLNTLEWFKQALQSESIVYSNARLEHEKRDDFTWVLTLAKRVSYLNGSTPEIGVLTINLRLDTLSGICQSYSEGANGYLMLTDADGEIVYSPRSKVMNLKAVSDVYANVGVRKEDSKQLEISQPLRNEHFILVGMTMESALNEGNALLRQKGLLMLALSLLIALILAWFLAEAMARPFRAMEATMERVDAGQTSQRLKIAGFKEFASVSAKYNTMMDKLEQLMREKEQKQEQLRKMEIATLQDQINPHFLYNALDSITWLVETKRNDDAIKMIDALAKLLRLSINRGGNFHTIEREVEHVRNYLLIQTTRYGKRFTSSVEVETGLEQYYCPRLILQPIVENAIKHGIADNDDCQIRVRIFSQGDTIRMNVWDDGMGLLPDKLLQVQQELRSSQPPRQEEINGLALKSVNRRIRLLCGAPFGITIDSETEEWTCVTITLPKRQSA